MAVSPGLNTVKPTAIEAMWFGESHMKNKAIAARLSAGIARVAFGQSTSSPGIHRPPGSAFRDCPACPEMVVIPAGDFTMGSSPGQKKWASESRWQYESGC